MILRFSLQSISQDHAAFARNRTLSRYSVCHRIDGISYAKGLIYAAAFPQNPRCSARRRLHRSQMRVWSLSWKPCVIVIICYVLFFFSCLNYNIYLLIIISNHTNHTVDVISRPSLTVPLLLSFVLPLLLII